MEFCEVKGVVLELGTTEVCNSEDCQRGSANATPARSADRIALIWIQLTGLEGAKQRRSVSGAPLHFTTTVYVSAEVFWDATASHKSAEGRYKNCEWSQLIVVEKREAVKRKCACRGANRLPDEQSEEPCEARSQGIM